MILSDKTIKDYIAFGHIKIFPEFNSADVRPADIRLHLGSELLIPIEDQTVDLDSNEDIKFERISLLSNFLQILNKPRKSNIKVKKALLHLI